MLAAGMAAMAQTTQVDPTQLKRAIKVGTTLPATCTAGDLFFKSDAPAGSNLYGCSSMNSWSLQSGSVTTVFGRTGAVNAQPGDYTFAQISGAASTSQLPPVTMRTDQSNTVTAGTQDFHSAAHTLPMKTGTLAALPATCSVGETYFATDAPNGNNLYGCKSANTWATEGSGTYTISSDGVQVGTRSSLNFVTGAGLTSTVTDTGSQINVQIGMDSAIVQTQTGTQNGTALWCGSTGGSASNYRCSLNPTAAAYSAGMVLHWRPDVNGIGGPTTLNVDQLGAAPLMLSDGVTNPGPADIVAGRLYSIWYDGTVFRFVTGGGSGGGAGAVTTVFGRSGAVTAQSGDYSAGQIAGLAAVATSGSYTDLLNKPAIPGALYSNVAVSGHAVTFAVDTYSVFGVNVTADVSTINISGTPSGSQFVVLWNEDATGGHSVAGWPGNWLNTCTVSTDANVYTWQVFTYDGTYFRGGPCSNSEPSTTLLGATRPAPAGSPASGNLICWFDATGQFQCLDSSGNRNSTVRTASGGTSGQLVDYISASGAPHTRQITTADVAAGSIQGNGTKLQAAGTISGTAGTTLCIDGNGNTTTSGCSSAGAIDNNTLRNAAYCPDTGSSNALVCTTATPFPAAYAPGQALWVKVASGNTGPATINVNSLGSVGVTKNGTTALAAGDLTAGGMYLLMYDGSEFQVQLGGNGGSSGPATPVTARAYNTAAYGSVGTSWTLLTFDTNDYDSSSIHSTVSNTSRFVAPAAGYYRFACILDTANYSPSQKVMFRLNAGGSATGGTNLTNFGGGGSFYDGGQYEAVQRLQEYHLNAGDYLEVFLAMASSTATPKNGQYATNCTLTAIH
jgi:hypothetical protein